MDAHNSKGNMFSLTRLTAQLEEEEKRLQDAEGVYERVKNIKSPEYCEELQKSIQIITARIAELNEGIELANNSHTIADI